MTGGAVFALVLAALSLWLAWWLRKLGAVYVVAGVVLAAAGLMLGLGGLLR